MSYIEYELITPFQLHLKSFIFTILQKYFNEVFHLNKHKCVGENIVEKLVSFEKLKNYVKGLCIKNMFYMFIKMLDEIKEKLLSK